MLILLKRSQIILSLVLIISVLFSLSYFSIAKEKAFVVVDKKVIIVDPGHGGIDGGAVGVNGTLEKDINLKIAYKLKNIAENNGVEVVLTRDQDVSLHTTSSDRVSSQKRSDLQFRKKFMTENPNYIFVSIHQNKFAQSKYRGAQVFYADNQLSQNLGNAIQESLITTLNDGNTRVAKKVSNDIFLLKGVNSAAVIVECGFLSNKEEEQLLNNEDYQQKIAEAIFKGVTNFSSSGKEGQVQI